MCVCVHLCVALLIKWLKTNTKWLTVNMVLDKFLFIFTILANTYWCLQLKTTKI